MLTRWRELELPFAFDLFDRRLDEVFEALAPEPARWPAVTLKEDAAGFLLSAELPGLTEKDVEIVIENDVVTLRGARAIEPPQGYVARIRERAAAKFERAIALPAPTDADAVAATLANGVLTITLPKAKGALARKINVKS